MAAANLSPFPEPLAGTLLAMPAVGEVLDELRVCLVRELGDNLVGLYLYGSLSSATSGPSEATSISSQLSHAGSARRNSVRSRLHCEFVRKHPSWDDRIEVAYVSTSGLRAFKSRASMVPSSAPASRYT